MSKINDAYIVTWGYSNGRLTMTAKLNKEVRDMCEQNGVSISGSISYILENLNLSEDSYDDVRLELIGLPVKDEFGEVIGKIICLDLDKDLWYAKVSRLPKTDLYSSIEFKEDN